MAVKTTTLLQLCKEIAYREGGLFDDISTVEGSAAEDPSIHNLVLAVNDALREMNRHEALRLQNARVTFNTIDDYTEGTVDVTQGSTTVTGTGVTWMGTFAGRIFSDRRTDAIYRIADVGPSTSLELSSPYVGDTASGINYIIGADRYEAASNIKEIRHARIHGDASGKLEIVDPVEMEEAQEGWFQPIGWFWANQAGDVGSPSQITLDNELSADGNFFYLLNPIPDDIYQVRLVVDLHFTQLSLDRDVLPIEDANVDVLRDGATARFKMTESENEKDALLWEQWIERTFNRFIAADQKKTDQQARIVPADIMRSRGYVHYGRPDWKDR